MATAEIRVNGNVGSDDNITLGNTVTLTNSTSAATYLWSIVSQPSGEPNAVLSSTTAAGVEFTANKEGSYLIRLIVDAGLAGESRDQVIVAVRELQTGNRIPAAGETIENNAETGWANTAVDQILQRVTRFTDAGVIVGQAGEAGLLPQDVVYVSDVVTIATGLPGERDVPEFGKASALVSTKVYGQLGVVQGGVDGSPAPADGDLIRVSVLALVRSVDLGTPGQAAGTPVYVSDTGRISLTPGTITRQIGTVIDDMGGGFYGVWVTGEGSFGTVQSVNATAPVTVTAGIDPTVGLAIDSANLEVVSDELTLTDTGVAAETYGDAAAEPESLMPTFTVDAKGRLTAASEAAITIGGDPAKTYVDNGDATTLAAAEAYAQTLAYGLSSKVPVHTGTTIPLPACTVNGTFQTLTADVHGPLLPVNTDGHDLLVGERLLVKNQVAQANNGIYVLTQKGATSGPSSPWILTRADDANTGPELCGSLVTVNVGNTLAGSTWIFAFNPAAFTLGTTAVAWTQLNAVPATPTVYGTVKLAGGLGGSGTLAEAPVLAVGSGYVSGVLPAAHGGTGLSTSAALDAFLVGDGSGGWTTRTAPAGGILTYTGSTLANVLGLRGRLTSFFNYTGTPTAVSLIPLENATPSNNVVIAPRTGVTSSPPDIGKSLWLAGENGDSGPGDLGLFGGNCVSGGIGGQVFISGGKGDNRGGTVSINGGIADPSSNGEGGPVNITGGPGGLSGGPGGAVVISAGSGADIGGVGGAVSIYGGDADGDNGGSITIRAGNATSVAGDGGDVYIYPGRRGSGGESSPGFVFISRQPGYASGGVSIDDAHINGSVGATAGQVFTANSSGFPTWQDLGGAAGPAARGAFRFTNVSTTVTDADYCVTAGAPIIGSNVTITLPVAALIEYGRIFIIKSRNSAGNVTVDPSSSDRIDGSSTSRVLALNDVLRIMRSDTASSEWIEI